MYLDKCCMRNHGNYTEKKFINLQDDASDIKKLNNI